MKRLLVVASIAFGMTTSVALAESDAAPGHENTPEHAKMHGMDHPKHKMKKSGDADKKPQPKSDDKKHKGHDQPDSSK